LLITTILAELQAILYHNTNN